MLFTFQAKSQAFNQLDVTMTLQGPSLKNRGQQENSNYFDRFHKVGVEADFLKHAPCESRGEA
jgi:hypothetical protein